MDTNSPQSSQPIQSTPVELSTPQKSEKINSVNVVVGVLILVLIFVIGYLYMQNQQLMNMLSDTKQKKEEVKQIPSITREAPISTTPTLAINQYANWKTYSSKTEKISFKYPLDWVVGKPTSPSNHSNADQISLQSPSATVKINWYSAIDGFGGACDETMSLESGQGCPLFTLIDKSPIQNAPGLFFVAGTQTRDGKIFEPYMAIQDSNGVKKTGQQMIYNLFQGRNNQSEMENNITTTAIFSLAGSYSDKKMSEREATSYFINPEMLIAKQILLSLSY